MTDTYVQVPVDGSGKKIRTTEITNDDADIVEQQVMELADETGNKLAPPAGTVIDQDTQGGVIIQGLVSDNAPQTYVDGQVRPLSLTNEGRLRVANLPARYEVPFFNQDHDDLWGMPASMNEQPGSPWGGW